MSLKMTRRNACCTLVGALGSIRNSSAATVAMRPGGPAPALGPLKVHPENPRYFSDGTGKAVYLTGSHVWMNLVDWGAGDPPPAFDYAEYLDFLKRYNHNLIRLWAWHEPKFPVNKEGTQFQYCPLQPWERTGPGNAKDGKPKFNLNQLNKAYFERLRSRVKAAGERGIYVAVMLFKGGACCYPGAWEFQFFNANNNVQGINADPDEDGNGIEMYTLSVPEVTAIQEAYVRKVVDTVNDGDNVLYEICNESGPHSTDWQYHMIEYVKSYEASKPKQHPVGMTFQYKYGSNTTLFNSPADWISPNRLSATGAYNNLENPLPADGRKVIISDTDHLCGVCGDTQWVWKSFLRGLHPIYMDPYKDGHIFEAVPKNADEVRRNMGYTLRFANQMDLAKMTPQLHLSSGGYCLANAGTEYLAYQPEAGAFTLELEPGEYDAEWFDPSTGRRASAGTLKVPGGKRSFTPPFSGQAVLYLKRCCA